MSNWDLGVVTDAGVTILNKIEAGLATAVIDTIVIGSGVYSSSEKALISRRTALKNQQLSATINATRFPDSSTLEVKASIDNTTVVTGFDITECGVYATVTEGGVTSTELFAVSYTESPDYMTAYNGEYPQIVIEDVYLPISNTASITVTVAPGAFALAEDLTDHEAEKATTAAYGHTKVIDDLNSASYADGEALAAHQGNVIKVTLDKTYKDDDTTDTDIADGDYFPYYDTSATTKKKTLWSTIIAKLKNLFSLGSNLAPIANGPKYPGTWSAGKQFVYQGQLCKTKVNVSSSDDINVGVSGNAELASDVTSQISNLTTTKADVDDVEYPRDTYIIFNAPVCKKYYGSFQVFIPIHKRAVYSDILVGDVNIYYESSTPVMGNYQITLTTCGVRIEFTAGTDYSGYLAAVQIMFK